MFKSLNLGAVRIYLEKDHLSEWQDLEAFLASLGHIKNIVGVGGNVRSLISIINDDINNSVSKKSLNAWTNGLWPHTEFVFLSAISNFSVNKKMSNRLLLTPILFGILERDEANFSDVDGWHMIAF